MARAIASSLFSFFSQDAFCAPTIRSAASRSISSIGAPVARISRRNVTSSASTSTRRVATAKVLSSPPPSSPRPPPPSRASRFLRPLRRWPWRIILPLIPIGLVLSEHAVEIMWVNGPSMTPYLNEDYAMTHMQRDMVLVKSVRRGQKLERGMVVVFRSPRDPNKIAIKRIIALPGDRVTIRPGTPVPPAVPGKPTQIVPWNHVWVEGDADDSRHSLDSNVYGPISMNLITGRVVRVLRPRARELRWEDWEVDKAGERQRARVEKNAVKVHEPPTF